MNEEESIVDLVSKHLKACDLCQLLATGAEKFKKWPWASPWSTSVISSVTWNW